MVATATIVPICFAALYHHCNAALYFHNLHGERYGGAVALGDESLENNADFFHCAKELASEPWPKATILARNLCVAFSLLPARMQTYVALMAMLRQLSLKFGTWLVSTFIRQGTFDHTSLCLYNSVESNFSQWNKSSWWGHSWTGMQWSSCNRNICPLANGNINPNGNNLQCPGLTPNENDSIKL